MLIIQRAEPVGVHALNGAVIIQNLLLYVRSLCLRAIVNSNWTNCRLQLDSFALLKKELAARHSDVIPRLVIAGGCRHKDDIERSESLQKYAKELGIDDEWVQCWKKSCYYLTLTIISFNEMIYRIYSNTTILSNSTTPDFSIPLSSMRFNALFVFLYHSGTFRSVFFSFFLCYFLIYWIGIKTRRGHFELRKIVRPIVLLE
jgi:hypothetical protein